MFVCFTQKISKILTHINCKNQLTIISKYGILCIWGSVVLLNYFLDRVVNKIIEVDKGKIYEYEANYSRFLELKAEREESKLTEERKIQAFLSQCVF